MIQIAIIHPQPIYSQALAKLLASNEQLKIVSVAQHLRQLIAAQTASVDVIIWHIPTHHSLPPGLSVLKERFPIAKVVALTDNESSLYSGLLINLGVDITISSSAQAQELFESIIQVVKQYVPPPSSNHIEEPSPSNQNHQHDILSPKELDVLQLICSGLSDQQIARKLGISRRTINGHRLRLHKKLLASNSAILVGETIENDLIPLP